MIFWGVYLTSSTVSGQENANITESQKKVIEYYKARVRDVVFQGKVVDFNGDPVPDAEVVIGVRSFYPTDKDPVNTQNHKLPTDSEGLFTFKGKGMSLFVRDIVKEGYDFKLEYIENSSFDYAEQTLLRKGENMPFDPDSKVPFVFKIRKRGEVDYLFTNSFTWYFRKSENKPFAPLLLGEWIDRYGKAKNPGALRSEQNKCIEISCAFNEDFSVFTLSFKGTVEGCSTYLSDTLLYEAPAEDYQQESVYQESMLDNDQNNGNQGLYDKKLYLYVKGPKESYYSRIGLLIRTVPLAQNNQDAVVQVHGEIYTNPEGLRHLDYDEDYNGKEYMTRLLIKRERNKQKSEAMKQKKQFDEEAFKKKIDKERELIKEEVDKILNNSK